MPLKQSEMFTQIGCFALKFKYCDIAPLFAMSLSKKHDIIGDVNECWQYVNESIENSPFDTRTVSLDTESVFENQWMLMVEWLDHIERSLEIRAQHLSIIYHMCKRIMLKLK